MKVTDISTLKDLKDRIDDLRPEDFSAIYDNCEGEVDQWMIDIEKGNIIKATYEYKYAQDRLGELEKMMLLITKWSGNR